jgi:RimJ/RimL family protein N-acetyltransferase
MASSRWPLADLRLQTPELELRWPGLNDLDALAGLAAAGVHDPDVQPFMVAWTDASPEERARSTLQYHWSLWGSWKPRDWMLELAVIRDGVVAGSQGVGGRDFAMLREVHTGSWLGRRYQGQGIGTQMRAAVLHLAFDGLGAGVRYPRRSRTTRPHLESPANSVTATTASSGTSSATAQL